MKKFEIKLKVGADNGNSEQDIIINGTQLQQADVYGKVVGRLKNLEELDQENFINNLEDNLVIGIATSKYINPGEYYIGNHTLRSGVTVRNTEVGADNNKTNSEVVYLNVIGQIAAYAVKKAYNNAVSDFRQKRHFLCTNLYLKKLCSLLVSKHSCCPNFSIFSVLNVFKIIIHTKALIRKRCDNQKNLKI